MAPGLSTLVQATPGLQTMAEKSNVPSGRYTLGTSCWTVRSTLGTRAFFFCRVKREGKKSEECRKLDAARGLRRHRAPSYYLLLSDYYRTIIRSRPVPSLAQSGGPDRATNWEVLPLPHSRRYSPPHARRHDDGILRPRRDRLGADDGVKSVVACAARRGVVDRDDDVAERAVVESCNRRAARLRNGVEA